MSIAILSIAFVSLFALLPVGLSGFRNSVDTTNATWIMQGLNSMVQTTEWPLLWGPNEEVSKDIYYFDEEGRLTDTELRPGTPKVQFTRVYKVKLLVQPVYRAQDGGDDPILVAPNNPAAVRVSAVMVALGNLKGGEEFDQITSAEVLRNLRVDTTLTVRTFVVSRMNSTN